MSFMGMKFLSNLMKLPLLSPHHHPAKSVIVEVVQNLMLMKLS